MFLVSGVFMTVKLYAPPPDIVVALWSRVDPIYAEAYN